MSAAMLSLLRFLLAMAVTFALLGANVAMAVQHGPESGSSSSAMAVLDACDDHSDRHISGPGHEPCSEPASSDDCGSDGLCCAGMCQLIAERPFHLPFSSPVATHAPTWATLIQRQAGLLVERPPRAV